MLPSIVGVEALNEYRLLLTFSIGDRRVFDVSPFLSRGRFAELKDTSLFSAVRVEFHTVAWPNGLDLDPETLYEDSAPFSDFPYPNPTDSPIYVHDSSHPRYQK